MKSQGKKFVPRVVAVEKSAEVEFPNVDAIYHNVFSVSPPTGSTSASTGAAARRQKRFDEPGLVRVYCNIHPQMVGLRDGRRLRFRRRDGPGRLLPVRGRPAGQLARSRPGTRRAARRRAPVTVRAPRARARSRSGSTRPRSSREPAQEQVRQGLSAAGAGRTMSATESGLGSDASAADRDGHPDPGAEASASGAAPVLADAQDLPRGRAAHPDRRRRRDRDLRLPRAARSPTRRSTRT